MTEFLFNLLTCCPDFNNTYWFQFTAINHILRNYRTGLHLYPKWQ